MLTGNEDVDINILSSLNLNDLRNVTNVNQYSQSYKNNMILKRQLKIVQNKVDDVIYMLKTNKRQYGLYLNPYQEDLNMTLFYDAMNINKNNNLYVKYIHILFYNTKFLLTFHLVHYYQVIDLLISEDELKEYLTQFYYNKLIY